MQIVRPCRARPPHSSRTGRTAKRLDNTWDLPLVDFALVACHAVVKGAVACSNGPIESVLVHVHETKLRISGQTCAAELAYPSRRKFTHNPCKGVAGLAVLQTGRAP